MSDEYPNCLVCGSKCKPFIEYGYNGHGLGVYTWLICKKQVCRKTILFKFEPEVDK